MSFEVNERLHKGGIEVGVYGNCSVYLKNDSNWLWLVLVPRVEDVTDLDQLDEKAYDQVMRISRCFSLAMKEKFPDLCAKGEFWKVN